MYVRDIASKTRTAASLVNAVDTTPVAGLSDDGALESSTGMHSVIACSVV